MTPLICPTCGRSFESQTDAMPFCSHRCRLIDLGRWLDEEIGLPAESNGGEQEDQDQEG